MQELIVVLLIALSTVLLVRRLLPRRNEKAAGCDGSCGKDCPFSEGCKGKKGA